MLIEYKGVRPTIEAGVFLAHNATVIGNVTIATDAGVWFGAVLRGDHGFIVVGRGSNVQDNAVLHVPDIDGIGTVLGNNVTIGHGAVLEGCTIEDGALIGMNAVVLPHARVGKEAVVAAGAVVTEGMIVPPRTLVAGVPASVRKQITGRSLAQVKKAALNYQALRTEYGPDAGHLYTG